MYNNWMLLLENGVVGIDLVIYLPVMQKDAVCTHSLIKCLLLCR